MTGPAEVIDITLANADQVFLRGYHTQLIEDLRAADWRLAQALSAGQTFEAKFTADKARVMRSQIAVVTEYVQKRLLGLTDKEARKAISRGRIDAVELINTFERDFAGSATPLRLDVAANFDVATAKTRASLIRQINSSWQRYGQTMTEDFERVLRLSMIENLNTGNAISRLISQAPPSLANFLSSTEPQSFPDPSAGYMRRRYWAERIVRTEKSNAYSTSTQDTIDDVNEEKNGWKKKPGAPKLKQKILAHFDRRTAQDSVYVHGQIRAVGEMFVDGAGREYLKPPARPNDREVLIPWRENWKERAATRPKTQEEIAEVDEKIEKRKKPETKTPASRKPARKKPRKPAKKAAPKPAKLKTAPKPRKPSRKSFERIGLAYDDNYHQATAAFQKIVDRDLRPADVVGISGDLKKAFPGSSVKHFVSARDDAAETSVQVTAVAAKDGKELGRTTRTIKRDDSGKLVAKNDLFKVSPSMQGKGVSKKVLSKQLKHYEKLGVDSISLTAAWTGRYVWPRAGYAADPATMTRLQRDFGAWSRRKGIDSRDVTAVIDNAKTVRDLARTRVGDRKIGKEFLLSDDVGMIDLDLDLRDESQMKIYKEFLSGK